jgi:hypothetical protein
LPFAPLVEHFLCSFSNPGVAWRTDVQQIDAYVKIYRADAIRRAQRGRPNISVAVGWYHAPIGRSMDFDCPGFRPLLHGVARPRSMAPPEAQMEAIDAPASRLCGAAARLVFPRGKVFIRPNSIFKTAAAKTAAGARRDPSNISKKYHAPPAPSQ